MAVIGNVGDAVLVHNRKGFVPRMIRWFQALRFRGADRKYTYWNHVAFLATPQGDTYEAGSKGIFAGHVLSYSDFRVVPIDATDADRLEMVAFARSQLGVKYGFLTIASIAISLLLNTKYEFGKAGTWICSEFWNEAFERGGQSVPARCTRVMPADIAAFFDVTP
jgi:hypothetical protein